ncbi:MAG: SpoIIE family protein phosphatase, partial [Bdellovibrionales bacterium]|nr:SpoIIE family protein phosphatase [Bdellovibrionales bacterium]
YRATDLYTAFTKAKIYEHFLIDKNGEVKLGPSGATLDPMVAKEILKSNLPEGALDFNGQKSQIVSYADAGLEGMKITAIVDRSEALAAVNALLIQSLLFFIALIASTVILGVIASVRLTSALRDLYEGTKLIAKGQFDVRIKPQSNDEVGGLAEGFNFMAGEVSRLMAEAGDKARMAGELETVKIVQETLFPPSEKDFGKYRVLGHFEPASECGGDWWNYSFSDDKLYLWIGDATGHGAPAAMVTSAAKAAATIIEDMPHMSPAKILTVMNKAIHETSKGRILMTFFVGCIDMKTGEMVYANASHEPPYVIHPRTDGAKITKKDLEPLIDAAGPRLGDTRSAEYSEGKYTMAPGDTLLMYTDGVVDLTNLAGKVWGERGFIKSICDSASAGPTADMKFNKLKNNITEFREKTELVDDITLLMCQYGEAA